MRNIKGHLSRFWAMYLAIAILVPTVVCYSINLRFKPTSEEIFALYIANGESDTEKLYQTFDAKMPSKIKELDIFDYKVGTKTVFDTFGKQRSDILILPRSFIVDNVAKTLFVPITSSMCGEYEPYQIDGSIYGIKVFDYTNKKGALESMIPYEQDYFMFINANSVHKQSLQPEGSFDDLSLTIWSEILKDEA